MMLRSNRQRSVEPGASPQDVAALVRENQRLREMLAEHASQGAARSGYLQKYRAHAASSLWAPEWENRYVIVRGQSLTYYRSEQDVQYPPRGQISLQGTFLDAEGLKRRRHWTFNVSDAAGVSLIRLSTESQSEYGAWLETLERAGCMMRRGEESQSHMSPSTSQVSDSDAVAGSRASPELVGQEVDSVGGALGAASADPAAPHGYTSDQSDAVGGPRRLARLPSARQARPRHGKDAMLPSSPVHTGCRFSLLSSERITFSNQSGLVTLVFIVLASTNFRLILENLLKYGLLFNPLMFLRSAFTPPGNLPVLLCWPALGLFVLVALAIERTAARLVAAELRATAARSKRDLAYQELRRKAAIQARLTENFVFALNLLNTTAALAVPCAAIHYTSAEPLPGFALTTVATILWLKLVSYAHVNWDLRTAHRKGKLRPGERGSGELPGAAEVELRYPENIGLANLAFFLVAPTLCYQLTYPRTRRLRVKWVIKRVIMLLAALSMMLFIIEQYMGPTIDNSLGPLQQMDWARMAERVLKLSLPTLYFWLAMFYSLFDVWLGVMAELTRFGDREFYKEWWNATTLGEYWRLWNVPVHKWMLRHVYFPCIRLGLPKSAAGLVVFFISAIFHELLVGVPLHMVRLWAFVGIMAQVPLMFLTEMLKRRFKIDRLGNVIFWVSFCFLGQPLSLILYYHDWRKKHAHS